MTYKEEVKDLFSVAEDYYLVHCISADFGMGQGIVVQFNRLFDMKNKLVSKYGNYLKEWDSGFEETVPCILEDRVFNLITKRNYWGKPTYESMENALIALKCTCSLKEIKKLSMPLIGCGLDRLLWDKVSEMINRIFEDSDIEILVCKQPEKGRFFAKLNSYQPKVKEDSEFEK